ncbi:MAG: hypothetical protein IJ748_02805 [Bacteroidales bacterium]|nr:hypothetical protein [Bacteroidales bacterium]
MKSLFKNILFSLVLFFVFSSAAVPADPHPHTVIQPNGKTLTFFIRGDERLHWYESLDGYTLLMNTDNYLEFACIDENRFLQTSGVLACNPEERGEEELSFLKTVKPKLFFSQEQIEQSKRKIPVLQK